MIRAWLVAVVATLVAAMALAGAGVASAHAVRIATDPADNAALAAGPAARQRDVQRAAAAAVRRDDGGRPRRQPVVDGRPAGPGRGASASACDRSAPRAPTR